MAKKGKNKVLSVREQLEQSRKKKKSRTAGQLAMDRARVAVKVAELVDLLEQQSAKYTKTIENVTTVMAVAHTMSIVDKRTAPVMANVQKALDYSLRAKTSLATCSLYLKKLAAQDDGGFGEEEGEGEGEPEETKEPEQPSEESEESEGEEEEEAPKKELKLKPKNKGIEL